MGRRCAEGGAAEAVDDAVAGGGNDGASERGGVEAGLQVRGADPRRRGRELGAQAGCQCDVCAGGGAAALLHDQRGEQRGGVREGGVAGGGAVGLEEVEEVGVVLFAEALEVEDFAEVGVGSVGDVDEVGLHEGFGRGGPHLEGFEDGVDP